jgi:hypothetical protein
MSKKSRVTIKSDKELSTFSDKNLLAYYRSTFIKLKRKYFEYHCDCCGTPNWEFKDCKNPDEQESEWLRLNKYVDHLKTLTTKRGHVIR